MNETGPLCIAIDPSPTVAACAELPSFLPELLKLPPQIGERLLGLHAWGLWRELGQFLRLFLLWLLTAPSRYWYASGPKGIMVVTRTRAEEYRRLAQECLSSARLASTEESRASFLQMAQSWFRLAEEQHDESANVEGSVPPATAAGESQPVIQQQQQTQPKKEDDSKD